MYILLCIVSISYELAYSLFPCRLAVQMWLGTVYALHTMSVFPCVNSYACLLLILIVIFANTTFLMSWLTLPTSKLEISKCAFENICSIKINIWWFYGDNQLSRPDCVLKNTPRHCLFSRFLPLSAGTLGQKELHYLPLSARKPPGKWLTSH